MTFLKLQEIEEKELVPGYRVRFVHSQNMTLAYWTIQAGAALPAHSHPHEQVASVIEGEFEMAVGGETKVIGPGAVVVVPSNTVHSGRAVTNCRIIDAFYPIREDYR